MKIAAEIHQKFPTDVRSAQMLASYEFAKAARTRRSGSSRSSWRSTPTTPTRTTRSATTTAIAATTRRPSRTSEVPVHRPGQREPLRLPRRGPGVLGPLQRGHREPEPRARDQARFRRSVDHLAVAYEGKGEYREGDQAVRARRRDDRTDPDMQRGYLTRALRAAYYLNDKDEARAALLQGEGRARRRASTARSTRPSSKRVWRCARGGRRTRSGSSRNRRPRLDALVQKENIPKDWKPHFPVVNVLMAMALEAEGKSDEALEYWKKNANPPNQFENFEERRSIYEARAQRGRGPRPQGRPRRRREADRREPQVEPELGAHAGGGDDGGRAAARRRCSRPRSSRPAHGAPVPALRDPAQASPPRDALRRRALARRPSRRGGPRRGRALAARSACSTRRAAIWRRSRTDGDPAAPRRGSASPSARPRPSSPRTSSSATSSAPKAAIAREQVQAPRPAGAGRASGARIFGGGRPARRARPRGQGSPPRRPGRVRRRGRALPRLARGPLRHGDREPAAPRAADARARAPRGGEPPAPRRDRAVRRGPALRRRLPGRPPRARPRRRAWRTRRSRSS